MKDSIITLLTSKRVIVALVALVLDVALIFGVDLDAEKTATLLTTITTLAGILIGGISVSDHGKALGQPAGVDHKGRGPAVKPEPEAEPEAPEPEAEPEDTPVEP